MISWSNHEPSDRLRSPPTGRRTRRDRRHQHLRPQLRRPLRGQRPRARRPDRQDQHRPAQVDPRDAAAARVRARLRPGRAASTTPTGCATRCAGSGPRGSGQFERICWDEALDEVARQMRRIRDTYGPAAILDCSRTGSLSMLHSARVTAQRLLHMFGGCTELWTNISAEAEVFAVRMTYGAKADYKSAGREPTDYVNSRLIAHVGLEPGRRHLRHRHAAVPEAGQEARACGSSAWIRGAPAPATSWPTSTSSSGRRPTPPRSSPWPT